MTPPLGHDALWPLLPRFVKSSRMLGITVSAAPASSVHRPVAAGRS